MTDAMNLIRTEFESYKEVAINIHKGAQEGQNIANN